MLDTVVTISTNNIASTPSERDELETEQTASLIITSQSQRPQFLTHNARLLDGSDFKITHVIDHITLYYGKFIFFQYGNIDY